MAIGFGQELVFFVAKVAIIWERGRKSMDHPENDLAKCGNKTQNKVQIFYHPSIFFCYTMKIKYMNLVIFTFFFLVFSFLTSGI
jgi:hypothetical protein